MDSDRDLIHVLLVDDEAEFRDALARALGRRGFRLSEAPDGATALARVRQERPDLVLLDLKMDGMDGITTLEALRQLDDRLPVILLTGHGSVPDALAGIRLKILDFLQKPVDVEALAARIRALLARGPDAPLRERSVGELMVPAATFPCVRTDQTLRDVLAVFRDALSCRRSGGLTEEGHRAVLVFYPDDRFAGVLRVEDVLRLVIPRALRDSPYASFYRGMFLARAKLLPDRSVAELVQPAEGVAPNTPLLEALERLVSQHLICLPVLDHGTLRGVLRDTDLLRELAEVVLP